MNRFFQIFAILTWALVASLYYLYSLNELTEMKLEIPKTERRLKTLEEEIERYRFDVERRESPHYLEELLRNPDLNAFLYPKESEVIFR